ncbi:MAG TPA: prenyltransferase/squalene oxidase repeat-containing protein [Gemmataceae bacterium]|nr:prenyltransferase/squalene oxidase repeat-containing protein [Gemmataceae bacterium]
MRPFLAALLMLISAMPAFAQPKKDRLSESVDRGLKFLALLQEKDGAWLSSGNKHPAVTSLAVMAFLSAGHVPGEGPYQANVDKGIRWVLQQQRPDGLIAAAGDYGEMYHHGICTMMLCEVAAMTDAKLSAEIKPKLEKAVKLILKAQRTEPGIYRGGWRYRIESNDADISVTGWQILALRGARNLGCDVPAERIDLALKFVQQCRDPRTNGFTYLPSGGVTNACTATSILALELVGKERHHSREALLAGSYLLKNPQQPNDPHFHYTVYYSSQAMFQLGNNYWNVYRPQLHKLLLDSQQRNGSWLINEPLGPSYATAMSLLALTVEYRLLPIYQRNEEPDAKKDVR